MSWLSDRTGIHINSINDITSGRAIKEAARNPLLQIGASMALPGVGGALMKGATALSKIPGVSMLGKAAGKVAGVADKLDDFPGGSQVGGALRGVRDRVVSGAKGALSGGLGGNLGNTLLAAAGGISAINAQNRANDLEKRALDAATSAYDERAPLRTMGLSLMQDQQAPSLSFAGNNAGNPYAALHGFSPAAPMAPVAPPAVQKRLTIRRAA